MDSKDGSPGREGERAEMGGGVEREGRGWEYISEGESQGGRTLGLETWDRLFSGRGHSAEGLEGHLLGTARAAAPCGGSGRGRSQHPGQSGPTSLTDAAQPVHGHSLEGPAHHGERLQHGVEVVHAERVEAAVGVGSHAGRAPAPRQQTDLCPSGGETLRTAVPRMPSGRACRG